MKVMGPSNSPRGSYSRQSTKEDLPESPTEHEDIWPKDGTETAQPFGSWEGEDNEELMLITPKHWTNRWGQLLRLVFTGFLVFTSVMILSMFLYDIFYPKNQLVSFGFCYDRQDLILCLNTISSMISAGFSPTCEKISRRKLQSVYRNTE